VYSTDTELLEASKEILGQGNRLCHAGRSGQARPGYSADHEQTEMCKLERGLRWHGTSKREDAGISISTSEEGKPVLVMYSRNHLKPTDSPHKLEVTPIGPAPRLSDAW
jgi:hypothetical protein